MFRRRRGSRWPDSVTRLLDFATVFAGVAGWAVFGSTLAVIFRSAPLALGVGFAWAGPFENIIVDSWHAGYRFFPGQVLASLIRGGTIELGFARAVGTAVLYTGLAAAATLMLVHDEMSRLMRADGHRSGPCSARIRLGRQSTRSACLGAERLGSRKSRPVNPLGRGAHTPSSVNAIVRSVFGDEISSWLPRSDAAPWACGLPAGSLRYTMAAASKATHRR